jgi:hypothetical protein
MIAKPSRGGFSRVLYCIRLPVAEHSPPGRARAEGEAIGVSMADIVNLQDRLKAKQDEDARYLERMDLTSRMIPVMVETVEKFASMGASPGHIVRFLQATIDEINNSEGPKQR